MAICGEIPQKTKIKPGPVAQPYNPRYVGDRDGEDYV
jgi:hypothetical protein